MVLKEYPSKSFSKNRHKRIPAKNCLRKIPFSKMIFMKPPLKVLTFNDVALKIDSKLRKCFRIVVVWPFCSSVAIMLFPIDNVKTFYASLF